MPYPLPQKDILSILKRGVVIPAHPLALTEHREIDEARQRALTRYYIAAGAGGIALGLHTTQFLIHDPKIGLYRPVLELGATAIDECVKKTGRPIVKIAGIVGSTHRAVAEAALARDEGYHAGLLSLSGFEGATNDQLIAHCRRVAEIIPVSGFYLQPAVEGRVLGFDFWCRFLKIENVVAIKIAPFNRYYTIDVIRAIAETGREETVALYTGNDDNIINDLLTVFSFKADRTIHSVRIVGGLLGQWAVWTKKAVELLEWIHKVIASGQPIPQRLLTLGAQITDANGVIFDAANNFAGCIPGIHEILRRQGLLEGFWCIDPEERLSPGQIKEINRIYHAYPDLRDDDFVNQHIDEWIEH